MSWRLVFELILVLIIIVLLALLSELNAANHRWRAESAASARILAKELSTQIDGSKWEEYKIFVADLSDRAQGFFVIERFAETTKHLKKEE